MREYQRNKKSDKFKDLFNKFEEIKLVNSKKYVEKQIDDIKRSNPSQFYKRVKKLGARLGECQSSTFTLPKHSSNNLTELEAAEEIAKHFSTISKEFPPIDEDRLPERVQTKVKKTGVMEEAPVIEAFQVYENMKKRKVKTSSVPGDLPPKLKKEFSVELAEPAADIFNSINRTGQYPRQWVIEYVTPIPKTNPPESEDDLRNISLTADLSKDYENLLVQWLLPYVQQRLDPGQFGGLKGCSIVHYLMLLFDFILSSTDTRNNIPKAVMIALVDFSKAFNRINHAKVITRLSDWGVPGWLLKILISYLKERSMIVRYKGANSSQHLLPGGGPQGSLLGMILYLIEVSDAGMEVPTQPSPCDRIIDVISAPYPPTPAITEGQIRIKYVDDLSLGECLRLDTNLASSLDRKGPRTYHDRNGLILPPQNTKLQMKLDELAEYANLHDMKINTGKSKIMPFNFTRKYDFTPEYSIGGTPLENVYSTKLLGLQITSDCKWNSNTNFIVTKASQKLWFLRRLKTLGSTQDTLLDIYRLFVRSHLELAAPVWAGALSKKNKQDIERIQKNAFRVITASNHFSYEEALSTFDETTLDERRQKLCTRFAKKCVKDQRFSHLFPVGITTRTKTTYLEPECKTKRYSTSCIPHLIWTLNA